MVDAEVRILRRAGPSSFGVSLEHIKGNKRSERTEAVLEIRPTFPKPAVGAQLRLLDVRLREDGLSIIEALPFSEIYVA